MRKVNITFSFTSGDIYYPGQTVQGEVVFEVKEEVKARELRLIFNGSADVHWSEEHGTGQHKHTVHYSSHEGYFRIVSSCLSPSPGNGSMMVKPGTYCYPFIFQIPMGCPSSFEGGIGNVRYFVKAEVDKPWAFDETAIAYFTVINLIDLNREPDAMNPGQAEDSKTLCCLCCASGPITGKHSLPKSGFVPGEALPINAELINHSNRNGELFMQLLQNAHFMAKGKTNAATKTIQETTRKIVHKGDSEYWSGEHIIIPPLPCSKLDGCGIINISYCWQLVFSPSGPSINLRVPIPIIIGGIPHVSSTQQYGAPGNFGGAPSYPPTTFPENMPQPSFNSFSKNPAYSPEERHTDNRVHPGGDDQQSFAPQYPYYNSDSNNPSHRPTYSPFEFYKSTKNGL